MNFVESKELDSIKTFGFGAIFAGILIFLLATFGGLGLYIQVIAGLMFILGTVVIAVISIIFT